MNKYLVSIYSGKGYQTLENILCRGNHRKHWLQEALVIVLTDLKMAKGERLRFAEMLLYSGASPDAFTPDHEPLLCWAVMHNDMDMVKLLLSFDVNVNAKDADSWTALHHCAHNGLLDITRALLIIEADANIQDADGDTALSIALVSESTNWDVVELLLFYTNVNLFNHFLESPLIKLALHNWSPLVVQTAPRLIQQGVDIDAQNMAGQTALMIAATANGGHLDFVRLLLEAGCDSNIKDHAGHMVLHLVAMQAGKQPLNQEYCRCITRELITAGADVNVVTDNDLHLLPPLGFAIMSNNWLLMVELLQSNCNPIPVQSIVHPFVTDPSMHSEIMDCLEYLMIDAGPGGFLKRWMAYHKVQWTIASNEFIINEICAPLTLTRLCRLRLRQALPSGGAFHITLQQLELPISVKRFIALQTKS